MRFLLPQGIGDSVWALHKIQSVAEKIGDGKIDVFLNCSEESEVQARALDFVKRFKFVDSARMLSGVSIHPPEGYIDSYGRYIYIPSGPMEFCRQTYYALMPNGHLERGGRLEQWLPEFQINWDILDDFQISSEENSFGVQLKEAARKYVVFYLGPMAGNMGSGHNRGGMWKPMDWVNLGERLHNEFGYTIVVVGADYDELYFNVMVHPLLYERKVDYWINLIGETNIGRLYATTARSEFVISYQSGVGIVSSYLGVPTGIFWRPKGNSINPEVYISFEEDMASAWTRPEMIVSGKHLPLIYGRHGVDYIIEEIKKRGWTKR